MLAMLLTRLHGHFPTCQKLSPAISGHTSSTFMTQSESGSVAVVSGFEIGGVWIDRCFEWALLLNEHVVYQ